VNATLLRDEVLALVARYCAEAFPPKKFIPGETPVPVSGKVFDEDEVQHLVDSALDFWLTAGRFAEAFEREFARLHGLRYASLCNSGSSANLLAVSALTSPRLGDRRLRPGDEVVTCATGFPTTVAPILQNGLVPVYVDAEDPETGRYNVDAQRIEEAIGPRTRAIVLAHALGNPLDLGVVADVARKRGLWLIEDTCDALGSTYDGKRVGTFGDLATFSYYPAHIVTTGEGGAVVTDSPRLRSIIESFCSWGRSCWCPTGKDNTCGKRFEWQLGELPYGTDHKYCLPADSLIETSSGVRAVGDLAQSARMWQSATLSPEHVFSWKTATATATVAKDVWRVVLTNGMHLRYGSDHPVLTRRGYIETAELLLSDEVAVAGRLPDRPDLVDVPDALLTIVGMLLADGSYVPTPGYTHHPINWYKENEASRETYMMSLKVLDIPFHIDKKGYIRAQGLKLHDLLTSVGILPAYAPDKFISDKLTALSARQVAILIRAIWSGDGTAKVKSTGDTVRVVYGSRSLRLCRGIQRLLFQLGILSTVTSSSVKYKGERYPYHFTTVVGNDSKNKMLNLLDSAPRISADVAGAMTFLRSGRSRKRPSARNPALDGDVWWVPIKTFFNEGIESVFEVEVQDSEHNFVADGVVTHNCYDHVGYNLKMTDMQAAVGVAQLKKLPAFIERRRHNFRRLREGLSDLSHLLILPEATPRSEPCWFGFPLTVREGTDRLDLVHYLEERRVATRLLFGGNLLRQPGFIGTPRRVVGELVHSDRIMRDTFWIGVYPGITDEMVDYVVDVFHQFARSR